MGFRQSGFMMRKTDLPAPKRDSGQSDSVRLQSTEPADGRSTGWSRTTSYRLAGGMTIAAGILIVAAVLIRDSWANYVVIGAALALSVASYAIRRRVRADAYRGL